MSTRTYAVFISYRHADNKVIGRQWASWLHHSLETYEVPPELVGRPNLRKEPVPASLFPVFRDEEELPADADLSVNIRRALERSGLLVVLCSPRAVTSPFVDEEIRYFKELGRSDRILALLIDGEPDARDPALECLPRSLRFGKPRPDGTIDWDAPTQPIAADTRPEGRAVEGWTTAAAYEQALEDEDALPNRQIAHLTRDYERRLELAKLKVIAGALGVDLGELTKRNQSFELAKARRRARVLRAWLAAVGILAIVAAAAGVIAFNKQREAEHQTKVATQQRDRALRELYVNIVRRATAVVEAGNLGEAREMLLRAPVENRAWEWWYLMARCGPAPMKLTEFAAVDGPAAAALKKLLDQGPRLEQGQVQTQRGRFGIVLKSESTLGRSGAFWQAYRVAGKESILLNGFQTAMYGTVDGVALGDPDLVSWRHGSSDEMRLRPPKMVSGEEIAEDHTDYVAFLRDRHIVADVGAGPEEEGGLDPQTWPDKEWDVEQQLHLDPAGPESVAIIGLNGARSVYDFRTSTQTDGEPPPPPQPQWDGPEIQNLGGYATAVGRGPAGPLVLSSWEAGNVRLRDGKTGQLLGESISGETGVPFTNGNAVAIVPGTEWIAGYFWWKDRIVAGVADLRRQRLLVRFEKALEAEPDGWHEGELQVSPDGREAVFSFLTRAGYYFAAWDVKSGKLVYGPLSMGMSEEVQETPGQMRPNYAWHPDGSFLALLPRGNVTELRRSFASAPFATLEGVNPGNPNVQEIGDPMRLLIGNWVVDRINWQPVFELPASALVSSDGNWVVLQTRPGVIELVRPGFRLKPANRRETALLHQIRARDAARTAQ